MRIEPLKKFRRIKKALGPLEPSVSQPVLPLGSSYVDAQFLKPYLSIESTTVEDSLKYRELLLQAIGNLLLRHTKETDNLDITKAEGDLGESSEPSPPGGKIFYHGSSDALDDLDPGKMKGTNLYGQAAYLTSDPRVAGSYSTSRIPKDSDIQHYQDKADYHDKSADERQSSGWQPDPDQHGTTEDWIKADRSHAQHFRELADNLRRQKEEAKSGPNITPFRVPSDLNLLDLRGPSLNSSGDQPESTEAHGLPQDVIDAAHERFQDPDTRYRMGYTLPDAKGHEAYEALRQLFEEEMDPGAQFGPPEGRPYEETGRATTKFLQNLGYHGILHTGGLNHPLKDDNGNEIKHDVVALFPNAVHRVKPIFRKSLSKATQFDLLEKDWTPIEFPDLEDHPNPRKVSPRQAYFQSERNKKEICGTCDMYKEDHSIGRISDHSFLPTNKFPDSKSSSLTLHDTVDYLIQKLHTSRANTPVAYNVIWADGRAVQTYRTQAEADESKRIFLKRDPTDEVEIRVGKPMARFASKMPKMEDGPSWANKAEDDGDPSQVIPRNELRNDEHSSSIRTIYGLLDAGRHDIGDVPLYLDRRNPNIEDPLARLTETQQRIGTPDRPHPILTSPPTWRDTGTEERPYTLGRDGLREMIGHVHQIKQHLENGDPQSALDAAYLAQSRFGDSREPRLGGRYMNKPYRGQDWQPYSELDEHEIKDPNSLTSRSLTQSAPPIEPLEKSQPWDFVYHHDKYRDPTDVPSPGDPAAVRPQPRIHVNFPDTPSISQIPGTSDDPGEVPAPSYLDEPSLRHDTPPESMPAMADPVLTNAQLGEPSTQPVDGRLHPLGYPDILTIGPPDPNDPDSDVRMDWHDPEMPTASDQVLNTRPIQSDMDPDKSYQGGFDWMTTRGKRPARYSAPGGLPSLDVTTGPQNPIAPLG